MLQLMSSKKSPQYAKLAHKWIQKHRNVQKDFWTKHKENLDKIPDQPKQMVAGSLAGLMMLAQPVPATLIAQALPDAGQQVPPPVETSPEDSKNKLINDLSAVLPDQVQPLTPEQEDQVSTILSDSFGMTVSPSYEGKRLNRSYGLIGQEQHLMRYPGDTMDSHFTDSADVEKYYKYGMAPGRGAWGYFANSAAEMTEKDIEREKYYIAVPTFLSPTWTNNVNVHYNFFKYRKMLVVNPENGKAVIADIGDAGPAQWTGKHLGGSPEVMQYLERVDGRARGPVLYFFIRDPQDTLPLGPVVPE